jgi:hypothetical protein
MPIIANSKTFRVIAYSNGALAIDDITNSLSMPGDGTEVLQTTGNEPLIYRGTDSNAGIDSLKQAISAIKE